MAAGKIKVVEKNEGKKIDYAVSGTKITVGEDELTVNLKTRERDYEVVLDICMDTENGLTVGVNTTSQAYIAQVEIPAREYAEVQSGEDEDGNTVIERNPIDFDMSKCTLILWALI
jgi:hypothetical protein